MRSCCVINLGLLSLALSVSAGCSATPGTIRGQSPDRQMAVRPASRGLVIPASFSRAGSLACCPNDGCGDAACVYPSPRCGPACVSRGCCCCGAGGINLPFHPVHRNYYSYSPPKGLSWPDQNQPTAVVQYPYYTIKGPTDFFYDPD